MEPSLKSIENPNHGNVLSVLKAFRFFNHTCYVLSITLKWLCSICEKVISYIYTFVGNFMCTLIFSANFTATPFETFWFMKYALFWFLYQCSKKKTDQNVFFLKVGKTRFFDNCKYVSSPKSYTLQSHITTSGKKSVVSPSIPNACMLSKFIHFQVRTMCVLVFPVNLLLVVLKSKCVHSDINVIS